MSKNKEYLNDNYRLKMLEFKKSIKYFHISLKFRRIVIFNKTFRLIRIYN
jgi:hypothetical protein